jgi:hypothetical protein
MNRRSYFMRALAIALWVLAIPCLSMARADRSSWTNLSVLQPGQKIKVVDLNSKSKIGRFLSVTDSSITLQVKSSPQTIQKQDVKTVRLMKNEHRLRNTFIGAGVGAGLGAGIGAASYRPCKPPPNFSSCFFDISRGQQAAIFGIVGFVGGAAVGALLPMSEIIYRAGGS